MLVQGPDVSWNIVRFFASTLGTYNMGPPISPRNIHPASGERV